MIIALGLYQGFTALDAIGPYEVLTYLPGAEMVICAERTGVGRRPQRPGAPAR